MGCGYKSYDMSINMDCNWKFKGYIKYINITILKYYNYKVFRMLLIYFYHK